MAARRLSSNAHIDLQPIRQGILLPFNDRPKEMKGLIECNEQYFRSVCDTVGEKKYQKLLHLWGETSRSEVCDADLLMKSQRLLLCLPEDYDTKTTNDNQGSNGSFQIDHSRYHLWRQFCNVIGYDMPTPTPQEDSKAHETILESPRTEENEAVMSSDSTED
ncbi:Schizosaccharomyces specific protein [Schizosaccharomyces osmophilus]|uniref:Schizosaccharomyces specific protein n=1 Tax=Schizosaccharomyces osmophilus TaxID=2545709 RepID=A0AAE9WER2_9SCHI|nr:Schizosaccharomyces specific protein [Schizosaccharomyces osmophilus]WBW74925.1 Schizosaccharomyces specific protein [Schizosaccharomyces osmophilus]